MPAVNQGTKTYRSDTTRPRGEIWLDAPDSTTLTSVLIQSQTAIFTGDAARNLGGSFDVDNENTVFKSTFGSSFGSLSFGNVAPPGLSQSFLVDDLEVLGSFVGGRELGPVDLIYVPVPEPSTILLAWIGLFALATLRHHRLEA